MNPTLVIDRLTKRYGSFEAVRDCSLELEAGSICGLLGPNGAGKSTTFKCLLGLVQPTSGSVRLLGKPLEPATFERLGYVAERAALFANFTVAQHLDIARHAYARFDQARASELVDAFSLDRRQRVRRLSKGQHTALAVVLAFAIRADLFVLDEPTSGLDPMHQRLVLDLMIEASAGGATVLFSSHQITQVERAADRVAIMRRGAIIVDSDVDALKTGEKLVEAFFERTPPEADALAQAVNVRKYERSDRLVRAYVLADSASVVARLEALGARSVTVSDLNLEDIFFAALEERRPAAQGATI